MSSLLLANAALVVTEDEQNRELAGASLAIEDGWIRTIAEAPLEGHFDERWDCSRFLVTPGLVNTHHHMYQMLTRGLAQRQGKSLFPWLEMLYPIWAGLDEEMVVASTRAGLAELALSGCTLTSDHLYLYPEGSEHFIDAQVAAATDLGIRFMPTRGSMDLSEEDGGLPPKAVTQRADTILRDSERAIDRYHDPGPGAMIRVGLAPCSPFSVTPELMRQTAELARSKGVRLHTHLAETLDEERYSRETFGVTPVELLESLQWLAQDVWLAHCVHLSDGAIDLFSARGLAVAHCPTSNMLLGSGLAPVARLIGAGVTVGLGVDGSASNDGNDLRMEMKQALLSARARDGVAALSPRQALWMATRGGALALGWPELGRLAPAHAADLALWDIESLALAGGGGDLVSTLVLSNPRPHTVLVAGTPVVKDGNLAAADQHALATQLSVQSARLLERSAA